MSNYVARYTQVWGWHVLDLRTGKTCSKYWGDDKVFVEHLAKCFTDGNIGVMERFFICPEDNHA